MNFSLKIITKKKCICYLNYFSFWQENSDESCCQDGYDCVDEEDPVEPEERLQVGEQLDHQEGVGQVERGGHTSQQVAVPKGKFYCCYLSARSVNNNMN